MYSISYMKRIFFATVLAFVFSLPYLIGAVAFILLLGQFTDINYNSFGNGLSIDVVF